MVTYLAEVLTDRQLHTWCPSIQIGARSVTYLRYRQAPSHLHTCQWSVQTSERENLLLNVHGATYFFVRVQLTSLLPFRLDSAFLTNRCMVSQLPTWWQSIQTGAWSVSYVPGGSPYKQVPGQSVTYLMAVHTDFCQVGQCPGLLQSPAGWLACLRHAV